jgi:hypothetical protein
MYATALAFPTATKPWRSPMWIAIGFDGVWTALILDAISSTTGLAKDLHPLLLQHHALPGEYLSASATSAKAWTR